VEARPRKLPVTDIETWMRDPYALYAKRILGLRALDPIDENPDAAERGTVIHRALEAFLKEFPDQLPDEEAAYARLIAIGREAFGAALASPGVWAFWWPRFERIARWFVRCERERRHSVRPATVEATGAITFDTPYKPFMLTARADRVDRRLDDGRLVFSDYKTGEPPTKAAVAEGFAPQLPLEAAIAAQGGFDGLPAATTADLLYWRLGGGDPPAAICSAIRKDETAENLSATALAGLRNLVAAFDNPATPYIASPRDNRALRYSDYAHLERMQEWARGDDGDEASDD
jgi:ATP-dependent helicase/nuclease subunit B